MKNSFYHVLMYNDISNEEYGQRHFLIETSSKILVDIIQIIPPSNVYLKN